MLAHSHLKLNQVERVREPERNALEIFARVGDISALALIIEMVATLLIVEGDRQGSAYLAGAVSRIKAETGVAIQDVELNRYPEMNELMGTLVDIELITFEEGINADLDEVIERARIALS